MPVAMVVAFVACSDDPKPADDGADAAVETGKPEVGPRDSTGHTYCEDLVPTPTFCCDLDNGLPIAACFNSLSFDAPDRGKIDKLVSKSTPSSLAVSVPALGPSEAYNYGAGAKPSAGRFVFGFELNAPAVTQGSVAFARITLSKGHVLRFFLRDANGKSVLEEVGTAAAGDGGVSDASVPDSGGGTGGAKITQFSGAIPTGAFAKIEIDVDPQAGKVLVSAGGAQILDATIGADPAASPLCEIGAFLSGPTADLVLHYDNITVTP